MTAISWTALREAPYVAPTPDEPRPRPVSVEAARALDRLTQAVTEGDAAAARTLAPSGDRRAARRLAAIVRNAADLRLTGLSLRYLDDAGGINAAGEWPAEVAATWRLPEDDAVTRADLGAVLVAAGEEVRIRSLADPSSGRPGRAPVWFAGRTAVHRSRGVLVVDRAGRGGHVLRLAAAAVPVVREVLPGWRSALVVEVPETSAALDETLGAEAGTYADVAAVTARAGNPHRGPAHVYVNPQVLARLSPVGAQVVMTHEATHVATGAEDSEMPLWLLEGFADYVALREVGLPVRTTAAQVIAEVRSRGLPARLPADASFDPTRARLGAAYEAAWLACVVIADAEGPSALVEVYRAVDAGIPIERAMTRSVGFGQAGLVRRWRSRLSDLAG